MFGDKERYSVGLLSNPKNDVKIEVPHELVDQKMHPLRYRSFYYGDYLDYFCSTFKENALDAFIGI
ncbi:putative isopenicillin N synthase [Medicago truncatula]|nr:putative isopenicillin N synthase [Medicago truncatula]